MTKTTKTVLIIIGSLLVLCACTAAVLLGTGIWSLGKFVQFADQSTTEDPQEVAQIASEISDFDLPEGFQEQYAMKIAMFKMVQYATSNEDNYIFLTEFPAGTNINIDEMMRQISNGNRNPNSPWFKMDTTLVDQKKVMIRGEETTLGISEGTSDQGVPYRMATATFQGRGGGPVLLMVVGPQDQWDEKSVQDFIASIQ